MVAIVPGSLPRSLSAGSLAAMLGAMKHQTHLDRVTDKISRGDLVLGTVVMLADPTISEILTTCGYDFLWIDMEHTALGKPEVDRHIVAARSQGVAPFVRVPWNDPVLAKPILEMGPAAIVFPFVNTPEDAARAAGACRYPPEGVRGFGPLRANLYGALGLDEYLKTAEREPWVVVQIEHVKAVRNLDAICQVPGIDSLLVGPFDLSASVGKPGKTSDPEVVELMDEIARVSRERGMCFGAFALSTDETSIRQWLERGASWLALDTDLALLARAGATAVAAVHRIRGRGTA